MVHIFLGVWRYCSGVMSSEAYGDDISVLNKEAAYEIILSAPQEWPSSEALSQIIAKKIYL